MANFCVNEYTESPQVRRLLLLKGYVGGLTGWYLAWASRSSRRPPTGPILVATFLGFLVTASYHLHIRRFWRDVGATWLAEDRTSRADAGREDPGCD